MKSSDISENYFRELLLERKAKRDLNKVERDAVDSTLKWLSSPHKETISLKNLLSVFRLVEDEIVVRIDTGDKFHYLQYDSIRNRVVYIDPMVDKLVPIEETDIQTVFENGVIEFVTDDKIRPKKHEHVTVVKSVNGETKKVVFGEYNNGFTDYSEDNKQYEPLNVHSLPREMTPEEIESWLRHSDSDTVEDIRTID